MTTNWGADSSELPLVLLHPLGADHTFWQRTSACLPGSRDLFTPDLPGHGSEPALRAGARIQDVTDHVLRRLDLEQVGVVDLLGVSLGGLVAQDLAIRHPSRVRRLVLADTVPSYPADLRAAWVARAATARTQGLEPLADAMETMWFSDGFRRTEPGVVAEARRVLLAMDPESYARTCEVLENVDFRRGVSGVRHPTLVVCGEHDGPAFVAAARWFRGALPAARLAWLSDARHAAVQERSAEFAAELVEFLGPWSVDGTAQAGRSPSSRRTRKAT